MPHWSGEVVVRASSPAFETDARGEMMVDLKRLSEIAPSENPDTA